ncbi:MAG: retron St85 family RNA-directed DNA polymerase [Candidatus Marinimicrobia bacterium]|nr:retron St85 family RNA-directed DNA polymerase [Candidatus Neomarinimicrobiota bacterium]
MSEVKHRLRLLDLPFFETIEDLAALIRVDAGRLRLLSSHPEKFYRTYRISKRSGGWRKICSPSKELKAIQAWILRNVLDKLSPSQYATAYVSGKRLLDNVSPHANNRYFISMDIRNFFPSVTSFRVRAIFEALGYSMLAGSTLARLCCYFHGLPQGGVTSPALSNLVCLRLDRRLAGLAARRNIVFTRYADDITFSSNNRNALCRMLPITYKILISERFQPNEDKLRVMGPRVRCSITGLVKDASVGRFGIGRHKKCAMRAVMHNLLARHEASPDYTDEASIVGWLSFLQSVDGESYRQMTRYWKQQKDKWLCSVRPV